MSELLARESAIVQRKKNIAQVATEHARSFHPPRHEWINHILHVFGTQPQALQQFLNSAFGESGMHLDPRKSLFCDDLPLPIDVKSSRCVLVQRRNTQNWPYTSCHFTLHPYDLTGGSATRFLITRALFFLVLRLNNCKAGLHAEECENPHQLYGCYSCRTRTYRGSIFVPLEFSRWDLGVADEKA